MARLDIRANEEIDEIQFSDNILIQFKSNEFFTLVDITEDAYYDMEYKDADNLVKAVQRMQSIRRSRSIR